MEIRATHRFARISPLKARDVARELKGLPASEALDMVKFTPKKAAYLVGKVLKSAIANAENNHDLAAETLIVKSATISEGPTSRRFNPRAGGDIRVGDSERSLVIGVDEQHHVLSAPTGEGKRG